MATAMHIYFPLDAGIQQFCEFLHLSIQISSIRETKLEVTQNQSHENRVRRKVFEQCEMYNICILYMRINNNNTTILFHYIHNRFKA